MPAAEPLAIDLSKHRLRRNPALDVCRFDQLSADQRRALADLENGGDYGAVLLPRDPASSLTAKLVDRRTAALLSGLEEPSLVAAGAAGEACDPGEHARSIAALVLDGVLQIESAGGFVSGRSAHPLVFPRAARGPDGDGLQRLSVEALRYAQTLRLSDARELSRRLYSYNRVPLHPRWQERFGGRERAMGTLGLGPRDHLTALLAGEYEVSDHGGWRSWSLAACDPHKLSYKLYVSPHPEALPAAFGSTVETLARRGVRAFKVGGDVLDLLRPDKLVAYFESRSEAHATAADLAPRLEGLRAQGVPFTAGLTADGMLSWGVDPPLDGALAEWRGVESWRLWITNQLAVSLQLACVAHRSPTARAHTHESAGLASVGKPRISKHRRPLGADLGEERRLARVESEGGVEPWRFALDHLRLQGVDTTTWTALEPDAGGVRW